MSTRLRVLFNTPNPKLQGGPPTHLPLLETQLRKHTHLETFAYGRKTDLETLFAKVVGRSKDLLTLRAKIAAFQPDIIHHNTAFDSMAMMRDAPLVWLAKQYKVPLLLKMHGSFHEAFGQMNPVLEKLRNFMLQHAHCIGVLSAIEKQYFLETWPFLGDRVKVVKNIIKPEFYRIERQELAYPTLLFISRFIQKKGIFDLLEAIPGVRKKFPAAQFIFVGSGSDAAEFDKRVKEKKLTASVHRVDHINNLETAKFYASAWALVFPTHFPEGMPMVVAEAMAAGVPIITTRTKFAQSYMLMERHCLFIDYKNPLSIENQIIYLLERPELRQQMSKNNRELAKSFQAEIVTHEFINIYHEVVNPLSYVR
jgi:glycosyltransferase involved in cell wall biosynthesis